MQRKEKIIWVIVIAICVVVLAVIDHKELLLSWFDKSVEETKEIRSVKQLEVDSGYSKDRENRYIVQLENTQSIGMVNEKYYVFPETEGIARTIQWRGEEGGEVTYGIYDKVQLNFYLYDNDKLAKTIDLSEVVSDQKFPYYITSYSSQPVLYGERWCFTMSGYLKTDEEKDLLGVEPVDFYLDLDTFDIYEWDGDFDKLDIPEEAKEGEREVAWKLDFIEQNETVPDIFEMNGLNNIGFMPDYMFDGTEIKTYALIWFDCEDLPRKGSKLYKEFPDLEKYYGKEGYEVNLILFDIPTNEEFLSYFVDEISFEGLTLGAEYTIDGQEHEIHSIDDYYMYHYEVHEWDEKPEGFEYNIWNS